MNAKISEAATDWIHVLWRPISILSKISPSSPNEWRWKWALITLICIEILSQVIIFNQPQVFEQAKSAHIEASEAKMKKDGVDPAVTTNAVQAMRDRIQPIFFIIMNSGRAVIETAARFAMITMGFWIVLRVFLNKFPSLSPSLEIAGLASAPLALGLIAKLASVLITGNLTAAPDASLFLTFSDPLNIGKVTLSFLNPFSIWAAAILALAGIHVWKSNPKRTWIWILLGWIIISFGFAFLQKSIDLRGA